ncbi:MAG TPA: lysylphosphatidylglycerol synthase transmembrane domain-containing protein [Ignavibacteriaceae bacterium]|nr:lysylphosphatidylglycerol synthase transmembrane domain-containing protein [Ignavibacteriaceae bacterium]
MIGKLKKKILLVMGIAGLVYLGFIIYADFGQVADAFGRFNWIFIPIPFLLALTNYLFRFFKWDYYLRILNIKIKKSDSLSIFSSGLIMAVTPGKMGEFLKAYLLKQITAEPISRTAPIIFAERITDFISLIVIALGGAYIFNYGRVVVILAGVFFLLLVIVLSNKNLALPLISLLEKNKFLAKHLASIHNAYESSYQMLKIVPLIYMTLLSTLSWFFECFAYYIILINFGLRPGLMWASFSYAFSTIVGAITMLPGGLGVTEGSLTFLLIKHGAPNEIAVASTFIARVVTLWFALVVGIISVTIYQNRFGKITAPLNLGNNIQL